MVELTFADSKQNKYISACGYSELIKDKSAFKAHWKPSLDAWFPKGVDEPGLVLMKIRLESAEFWETPGTFVSHTFAFIGSKLTGSEYDPTLHGSVRV